MSVRGISAGAGALLVLLGGASPPAAARSRPAQGTIAVLNVGRGGHEAVERAARELDRFVGGWARQASIAAHLAGRPNPGALPPGRVGQELAERVRRVRRGRRPAADDLFAVGRMLAVDYLLLLKVGRRGLAARLYSVHRRRFAPQGFERDDQRVDTLAPYILAQARGARGAGPAAPRGASRRWWVWVGAAVVAVTVAVISVVAGGDDREGELTIGVQRK